MKVVNTVIKKETGTAVSKLADPNTATLAQTATKLNEVLQQLKDQEILK